LTQLVHLQDLNISGNALTTFPDSIGSWQELKKLSLHGNKLHQLPQHGWEQLQQLDEVCVQGNQLTALPDGIAKLGVSDDTVVMNRAALV
jgi:Leucine-rich repeat (LRR) protein